jgi:hypothetical protein
MDDMRVLSLCIVVAIFLLPLTASAINWEKGALDISLSSETYYQDVKGNEEKSALDKGWFYVENLILDLNQELAEKAKFQGYAHVRSSNDPQHQIDRRDWMFVEGYARLADDLDVPNIYEVWGGDFAESYTPYTLGTSLLGTKAFYKYRDWIKVSTFWGRNRDEDLDDYIRYSAGGRMELYYKDYLTIGGTFVHSDVARSSLKADSPIGDQFNQVFGGDLHLKLWKDKIHLATEYARSIYNEDRRDSTLMDQGDNAILVKGDISPADNLTISAEFERVEPWFNSVLGAASPDIERVKGEVDYTPWDMMSMTLFHEYSFDKVNKHSLVDHRTHTHLTSFTSTITPFYTREDVWNSLAVNLQIDHSKYYTKDHPRTTDSDDLRAYGGLSQSFSHWNYSLGYTYSMNWNRVDETSEFFSHSPTASIGINYPWLALAWAWTFNGSYEYREYILSGLTDLIYSGGAGLFLSYERTKSTLGLNVTIEYYDNASGSVFGTPDNISRTYSATFEQVLWEKDYLTANLTLSASYRDYDEYIPDEDYTEGVYYCGLTVAF